MSPRKESLPSEDCLNGLRDRKARAAIDARIARLRLGADKQNKMYQRRITLADGRYLIFYTFNDSSLSASEQMEITDLKRPEPEAESEAVEERRV